MLFPNLHFPQLFNAPLMTVTNNLK